MKSYLNDLLTLECNEPLITLYIFSSQTNPTWKMNITQIYHIKNLVNKRIKNSLNKQTINIHEYSTRIMGYQGFSISCSDNNQIFIHGLIDIEKQLLESGKSYLSSSIIDHVNQFIGQTTFTINYRNLPKINCNIVPIKGPDNVPIYNPLTDNGGCFLTKQSSNNCYAYGNSNKQILFLNLFYFLFLRC